MASAGKKFEKIGARSADPCSTWRMDIATMNDRDYTIPLLRQGAAGDQHALGELWHRYRERLKRMVRLRLDRRLQGACARSSRACRGSLTTNLDACLSGRGPP